MKKKRIGFHIEYVYSNDPSLWRTHIITHSWHTSLWALIYDTCQSATDDLHLLCMSKGADFYA